jgi:hypothetical protein
MIILHRLSDMANFRGDSTGLPMVVHLYAGSGGPHAMRVKASKKYGDKLPQDSGMFAIAPHKNMAVIGNTGDIKNADIEILKTWIKLNLDILDKYWNGDVDTLELVKNLKKI